LTALALRAERKSAGTMILVTPARLLKRVERTSYILPSTVDLRAPLYFWESSWGVRLILTVSSWSRSNVIATK